MDTPQEEVVQRITSIRELFQGDDAIAEQRRKEMNDFLHSFKASLIKSEIAGSIPVKEFVEYLKKQIEMEKSIRRDIRDFDEVSLKELRKSVYRQDVFEAIASWWDVEGDMQSVERRLKQKEEMYQEYLPNNK